MISQDLKTVFTFLSISKPPPLASEPGPLPAFSQQQRSAQKLL